MKKAVAHLRLADPVMARLVDRVGTPRIHYHEPGFQALARSIVFQQLNGTAAATIYSRFEAACGGPVTPEAVLNVRRQKLRRAGLSERKVEYIRDLASHTHSGAIDFTALKSLPDDVIVERLTTVRGIGEWTVHMFLIFALRRPDVLPVGDYGVRVAIRNQYGLADLPKPAEMRRIAEPWRPWASVASWYLWRSLEDQAAP
jgi:DNA-3-methyladenine glycosylase II